MITKLSISLEQGEFSGLLQLADKEMRSPAEQMRFLLIQNLKENNIPLKGPTTKSDPITHKGEQSND